MQLAEQHTSNILELILCNTYTDLNYEVVLMIGVSLEPLAGLLGVVCLLAVIF